VCTIAVADALLHGKPPGDALYEWCTRYPGRGYGGMFAQWLRAWERRPYGSFGNGAAMRVSPAGLLGETLEEALICALDATDFEDAIRNAISLGGDADTLAAIAGGVAEALFGISDEPANEGRSRLPRDMRKVLDELYERAGRTLR
jgi:ADP-ribosylglycohydrolase